MCDCSEQDWTDRDLGFCINVMAAALWIRENHCWARTLPNPRGTAVLREAAFQQCSPQGRKEDPDVEENACVPHGRAVVPAAVAVTSGVPETNQCISFSSTKKLSAKQQEAPLEVTLLRPRLNRLAARAGLSSQGGLLAKLPEYRLVFE